MWLDPERSVTHIRPAWPSPRTRTSTATAGIRLFLVLLCVPLAVTAVASETSKPLVDSASVPNGTKAVSAAALSQKENATLGVQPGIRLELKRSANNSTTVTATSRKGKADAKKSGADLNAQGSVARGFILPQPNHKGEVMLGDRPFVHSNQPGGGLERMYMPIRLNPGERIMSPQEVADWVARGALADFEAELVRAGDIVQNTQVLRPAPPPRLVQLPAIPRPTVSSTFGFPRLRPHRPQQMGEHRHPFGDTVKVLALPPRPHRPAVVVAPPDSHEQPLQHGDYLDEGPPPGLTVPSGIGTVSQPETVTRVPHFVRPVSPPLGHMDWVPRRPSSPLLVRRPPLQQRPSASQDSVSRVQVLQRGVPTATSAAPATTPLKTPTTTANKEYEYVEYEIEEEPVTASPKPQDTPGTQVIEMILEHGGGRAPTSPAPNFGTRLFHEHGENRPHSPQYVTESGLWKDTFGTTPSGRRGNGSFVVRSPVELSFDVAASDTVVVKGGRIPPLDTPPPVEDEARKAGGGDRFRLTTVNLAYILIGSCTAVSVICLAVVAASLRCRSASHRKNLRHLARDIEARRRWHRRIHQLNQQTTAKGQQKSEPHAPASGAVQHNSTCSSSASCSTVRCCCGTWTLGAKNLDSRALTSSPRKGPRRLPFGAASSLHCRALGVTDDHKSCSSDDDSLDGRSWADDCSSCAPRCTCVTAAVVHDWNLAPDSLDAASRQSTAVLAQGGPTKRHKPPPPPPPPKPSKFRCPRCSGTSTRITHPSPVNVNGKCCKDGSVMWSSNDERLI